MGLEKKKKNMISIILIALTLFGIYTLKSGSESFAILDIENLNSLNNPILKKAVESTEKCNNLGTEYRNRCYKGIAWGLGYYYEDPICEKLKEELKPNCYTGYGKNIGKKYSPDIKLIQDKCSKITFPEECIIGVALIIGEQSLDKIEPPKSFKQERVKEKYYEGIGRQLAKDNKDSSLCEKMEGKENCLYGFAYITNNKGNQGKALHICDTLNKKESADICYSRIGLSSIITYNMTMKEAFKNCEQCDSSESCKQGAAEGLGIKIISSEI